MPVNRHVTSLSAARAASLLLAAALAPPAAANSFSISPSGFSAWDISIDGETATGNPTLTLMTGQTYTFTVSASFTHPFWIKTVQGNGSSNGYAGAGLSDNGVTSSTTITFDVPADAPATLFYNCGNHTMMTGTINVVPDLVFRNNFE